MKKILIILCLFLLNVSAHAETRLIKEFNKWLVQNEFKDYYKLGFAEPTGKCKDLEKFSHLWYYNKCDKQRKITANYDVNTYNDRDEIPENVKPNFDTLLYYYWKYTNDNWNNNAKYADIKPSENPSKFEFDLIEDLFQAMEASPELRKKVKEDYKAQIEYYDSLSNEEKKFERESLKLITENMNVEKFLELPDKEKKEFAERLKKRFTVN